MHSGIALALPGLLPARQDPAPLLRLLRPRHDRLRRSDNHLLQRGEQNMENSFRGCVREIHATWVINMSLLVALTSLNLFGPVK